MQAPDSPRIAFLGICDRVARERNVDPRFAKLNILGLRSEVVASIYPLPLKGIHLIFAIYDAGNVPPIEIIGSTDKRGEMLRLNVTLLSQDGDRRPPPEPR